MILTFVIALLAGFLFQLTRANFQKDVENITSKFSLKKYLADANKEISESLGDQGATWFKIIAVVLVVVIILTNALYFLALVVGIVGGVFIAAYAAKIPAVANYINKMVTYINRLKK